MVDMFFDCILEDDNVSKIDEARFQFLLREDDVNGTLERRRGVRKAERHTHVLICT